MFPLHTRIASATRSFMRREEPRGFQIRAVQPDYFRFLTPGFVCIFNISQEKHSALGTRDTRGLQVKSTRLGQAELQCSPARHGESPH